MFVAQTFTDEATQQKLIPVISWPKLPKIYEELKIPSKNSVKKYFS